MNKKMRLGLAVSLPLIMAACTTVPKDNGIAQVQELLDESQATYDLKMQIDLASPMSAEEITAILSAPLNIADAERMSLHANPEVQANLMRVGIAEADYAQAGRMRNPGFTFERFAAEDYSLSLLFDLGGLLLMPLRRQIEARRLEVANQMTRQMSALGHSSVIESAESEILLRQLQASMARQKLTEAASKEALIRQLGLWGSHARMLRLPDTLPELPENLIYFEAIERDAIQNRLDVQIARLNLESMAKNLKLTQLNPFISSVEVGALQETAEGLDEAGYELELSIPIFDAGGVQNARARTVFERAQAQAEVVAIAAASESRQAFVTYQTAWDLAKDFGDQLIPLRKRVSQERLLMYNGMLISVFDLLADVRSAASLESDYVDAVRDFWLADANLQSAIMGTGSRPMIFEEAGASLEAGEGGADH